MTRRRNRRASQPAIQGADQAAMLGKRWHDIRDSLAGVKAKLRIVRILLRDFSNRDSIEGRLLASAFRDPERLKAGTA
jgi:hypothetical protein